jgi:hypothetical protein
MRLAHPPSDQLSVLSAKINYENGTFVHFSSVIPYGLKAVNTLIMPICSDIIPSG